MFIDTPSKKRLIFSIIIYFPIISLLAGTPLPFPSLFEPSAAQIAMLNGINLSISIIGAMVGVGFYLRKHSKDELTKIEEKIGKVDDIIGEMVIGHREETKELRKELREAEDRICNSVVGKNLEIEKSIEVKVAGAKELVDTRFKHLDSLIVDIKKSIDFMQQFQFGSGAKSVPPYISGQRETQEHKDRPFEGIYHSPDSSETQKHKDKEEHKTETRGEYEQHRKEDRINREKASKKRRQAEEEEEERKGEEDEKEQDW